MSDRSIHATLLEDGRVRSLQNPQEVFPGDTVEWSFIDAEGRVIQNAQIEFVGFIPEAPPNAPLSGPEQQPFTEQLSGPSQKNGPFSVADIDRRGLYLYVISRDGNPLDWELPLFTIGDTRSFFGGIIVRDPPVTGGTRVVSPLRRA
jgi:hypothetical protein